MRNHTLKGLCLAALVLSGIGWGAGRWYAKRTDIDMRQRLLRRVVSIARTFRPERVKELSFTDADVGTPSFEYIRQQMIAFSQYLPQRGIYSMAMRDGTLVFGPENYRQDDPMASPPGTVYERPSPADMAIFTTGEPVTIGPTTDEYGTFVSALAPVLDPDTGQVLMAVGMDITTDDWLATTGRAGRNAMGATVVAGLVVLGGLTGILRWRHRLTSDRRSPKAAAAHDADRDRAGSGARRFVCTGLLLGMGVLAIAFLAVVLLQSWHWTHTEIHRSADQQTRLAAQFDLALRDYMSRCVRPEMEKRVEPGEFFPETMSPSFISRSVFDDVRRAFPDSILRFASTNPRNPANQATPSEEALIRYFEQHPETDTWSGTMPFFEDGQRHSVHAKARRFQPSCLQCHGRPEDAPAALVERYGDRAGFGRLVGEVSLDLAAIPVSAAYAQAGTRIWRYMLASCALCILFLGAIIILIRLDIRQRRRSEASLRASGQRLARIIQQSPIPTFLIDANHRVANWNRAIERLTGITADQIIGTREHWRAFYASERPCMADLLVDGSIEAIPQWYQASFRKSELVDEAYEASAFFPDIGQGGRWLHFTAAVIRDDQNRIVGVMETLEDITQRKQAEEELHRQQAFTRTVLDNIPIGVAVGSMDPVVRFEYMNDNFPRFYQTTQEVLAHPDGFWEAVYEDPDRRREVRRRVLEDCASGDPERMHWDDIPITRQGQETTFISAKNAFLPGRSMMISIVWDVTKRNRAETRLKESLSLLKATLESTADGILVVDGLGKIKDFNEQFKAIWRLSSNALETMDDQHALAAALPQLKDPDVFVTTLRVLYRQPRQEGHGTLHFKDGRVVEYCAKPQLLGERIVGLVWSFRDVTESFRSRQKQDELLRQVAAINEELSHFAYVVSHDLKAPLRGIKMLAEWLSADCGDQLGDEAKENLDLLQNRVDRMHNLIEGVLRYSRIGRITEDVVSVDLNVLL
ncbi:MAG TPA: DUF3365 domain-containing protein, partial [Sedimentisphaerales bacterium]|nr:DUF3365 domain-containing protein [Sedimentisphaerales bacterium]